MNPIEKGPSNLQSPTSNERSEPEWIRDPSAANVQLAIRDDATPEELEKIITAICEGEEIYCVNCGEKFAFWPPKLWADHSIVAHSATQTILARTNLSALCAEEMNQAKQLYFSAAFGVRATMRRRAWKLGYAAVKPGRVSIVQ
jgi:hypothetical protein